MTSIDKNSYSQQMKPTLSKSWTEVSSHSPSYSGGKVTLCASKGTQNLYGFEESDKTYTFILAPCAGDLSIIDAEKGVKARTIRAGCLEHVAESDTNIDEEAPDSEAIVAYALAPNDFDLITAARNNIIRHYDISGSPGNSYEGEDGKGPAKVRKILGRSGHDLPISCIEFHCSGIFFATGSIDGNVKVWDLRGGYVTHSYRYNSPGYKTGSMGGLRGSVTALGWCPDLTKLWLGVGRDDGTVRVHDLRNQKEEENNIIEMDDHVGAITCMAWTKMKSSSRFDMFLTSGRDEVINLWKIEDKHGISLKSKTKKKKESEQENSKTMKTIYKRVYTLPTYERIEAMTLIPNFHKYSSPLGNASKHDIVFATAGSKGIVRLWKATHSDSIEISSLFEQTEEVAFGQKRGGYKGLLLASKNHKFDMSAQGKTTSNVCERMLVIDAEHNMSFLTLNNDQNQASLLDLERTMIGHNDEILDLRIIPHQLSDGNDRTIAVATNSAQIRLFNLASYSCSLLDAHTETVLCLDVSPCGRYMASSGKDKTTRLWHLKSKKCIAIATGHTEAIGANALSQRQGKYDVRGKAAMNGAGCFLVTASKDKTLKRWNLPGCNELDECATETNKEFKLAAFCSVRAHEKDINIVSVAPNDSLIATGSQDKLVKLWNSTDLTLKGVLKGHKRGVWDCQFSKFDRIIATCSGDKSIKLWSLSDFTCVRTFQGHSSGTLRVRFVCAGMQLMTCDGEGIMRLWNIRKNECTASIEAHEDKIWALDCDGKMCVTGGADSSLKVFYDTTIELEEQNNLEQEKTILMEQKLANHLRFKEFDHALNLALEMDKPRQTLKVLSSMIANDIVKHDDPILTLKRQIQNSDEKKLLQLLSYCRDWNTLSRNSHTSMMVMKAIFTTKPIDELSIIEGAATIIEGMIPYAKRHFERIDKLFSGSFLVDFTLSSMGDLSISDYDEYHSWESQCNLVLPPKTMDGRIQKGGQAVVGPKRVHDLEDSSDDDVITVGESLSSRSRSDDESINST